MAGDPVGALDQHPHLVSHVFLDPNGASIFIMRLVGGWFELQMPTGPVSFERLEEAEMFAAGALAEREGVPS